MRLNDREPDRLPADFAEDKSTYPEARVDDGLPAPAAHTRGCVVAVGYPPGVDSHSPPDRRRTETLLGDLLRWGISASAAGLIAFALLGGMARMVDGQRILNALVRLFPLSQQAVGEDDLAALPPEPNTMALSFEGTVGYLAGDRFVALGDALIEGVGTLPGAGRAPISVGPDGHFLFDAALPKARSADSPGAQLLIRRPGCSERRLPVTAAWRAPRRITLDCD